MNYFFHITFKLPKLQLLVLLLLSFSGLATNPHSKIGGTKPKEVSSFAVADYTITTTGGNVVITDVSGGSSTLTVSESGTNIRFYVPGRTYQIDAGAVTAFTTPADIALATTTSITINTAAGTDIINVVAFTLNTMPSLTINGGTGNDVVNFNGDITFATNADLDVDLQNDDTNPGVDAITIAANANLLLSGTGTATVKVSKNVTVDEEGSLETVNGDLVIEANQQTTPTTGNFYGVHVAGTGSLLQSTGSGLVTIKGKGGNNASGDQHGVYIQERGKVSCGTGSLMVTGTGGASEGDNNYGVFVHQPNSMITSSGGNVNVTGQGGGSGASRFNRGVFSIDGEITAGGNGTITVEGTGGATTGDRNQGICLNSAGKIISSGGNVSVIGQGGGSDASYNNYGVYFTEGGVITAGGNGTVTVQGTGGAATGSDNFGVFLQRGNSRIISSGGNVTVIGKEGGGLNGIGIVTIGISGSTAAITTATNGGNIALIANSIDIQNNTSVSTNTTGTLTLHPFTNNTAIDLGSATNPIGGSLSLSDAELDRMTTGTFLIGDANSGAMTVSAAITRSAATNVQLISSGDVILSGGGFNTNGGTLLLDPGTSPAAVKPSFNGTDVTASTLTFGSDLAIAINGTTPGTQFDQLKVAGIVDLSGVTLKLSGTPSPALSGGETFILVDNDDTDAIVGTFTGLAQGATISNFLGSALNATISYTGGTGNDVVITVNSLPDLTITKTTSSTFIQGGTAIYTLTVNNIGTANSSGTYTVTDALPSGLTLSSITSGAGWNCTASTSTQLSCVNSNVISSGLSAAGITVNVNIAGNAPASITNTASVSGGGETNTSNNTGSVTSAITGLPNYTITTTGNVITLTDVSGNGETLTVSENGSSIHFNVTGRTYSLNGGVTTSFPADVALSGKTGIVLNTANGADIIDIGAFTANLPSLTVNGGTGDDAVNFNGDITFIANSNLDVDMQNDDATPGIDAFTIATNANVQLLGTGAATVKVSKNIIVNAGGSLETANGNLTVEANQQATPTAGNFKGVTVTGAGSRIQSTGSGLVTINGKGGNSDFHQHGVQIVVGGKISGSTVTVAGNGGSSSDNQNHGVFVSGASFITSSGGNVTVTGTGGGSGVSGGNFGVQVISASQITAGGTGTVTVTGNGGTASTGNANYGVIVTGNNSRITSSGGNVSVSGTGGGSGTSASNYGVWVYINGQISAGSSGTVTVTGNGGSSSGNANYGVLVETDSYITSSGGNVSVTGTEGSGTNGIGILTFTSGSITTAANGGNLSLISNSMYIPSSTSVSTNTAGTLTLRPFTANTAINLGSATDPIGAPLSLSDTELDLMTTGTLIIGDANSGAITVSAAITRPAATNVQLISAGDVILSGGGFNTGGGTMLLDPGTTPAAVKPTFNGTDVTASTLSFGSDLALAINGTTPGTQYDQLKVVGGINLTGVNLVMSGTPALVGGETFILVDNDNTDAIVGTFTGLAQGATISNFLGSGLDATISYSGGTGNDVVITVASSALPDLTITKATSSTFIQGGTAIYNLTVNNIGTASSAGTYTITDPLPSGLTVQSVVAGAAWNCTSSTPTQVNCISTTAISSSSSAGVVQVIVNIAANAPASITNTASISGGGETNTANNTGSVTSTVNALPNYTITTAGNIVTLTDVSGNGETLTVIENGSNIRFNVIGRTYSLNGGPATNFPADIPLSGKTDIILNTANGVDIIDIGAFTAGLPSLTVNGGTGNDAVNFNGDITFATNANLDVDLQNDDANPGVDVLTIAANANLLLSGTGTATVKVSKNVIVNAGGSLQTVNGNLTVEANQQAIPTAGDFKGVRVTGTGGLLQSTGTGLVSIKGKGGNDAVGGQFGVWVESGGKINGGTGSLTVTGNGGSASGNSNIGVAVQTSNAVITSSGGNVTVTGTGGGVGASSDNYGVFVGSNSQITAGGTGTVTVTGNGGSSSGADNFGLYALSANSLITSSGGNVSVTGKEGNGSSGIGIKILGGGITTATNVGNLTLIANSMDLSSSPVISTSAAGTLTLRPFTTNTAINLGSATNLIGGPLSLSDAELDFVSAGTLVIGDANSNTITISANITRPTATNVQLLSAGDVSLSGGGFNTNGGTLFLDPGNTPAAVKPTFNGTDVTASTLSFGSDLAIAINGTTPGAQYDQLKVVGSINLTGVSLVLSGAPALVGGETFTIVDNDGTDAITGTFTGLAQGASISNFLGSGLNATISYSGGTGNDAVISVSSPAPADYTITTTGNAIVITDVSGNGETLTVSENGGNIRFNVTGRTYQIDAGAVTPFTTPSDVVLSGKNSITINTANGADIINIGAFTATLPSLTINGGTGDDAVNFNGNITFANNANLDLDLQNDDATPGADVVTIATNANLLLSGTGIATVKVSKNITVNAGGSLQTVNGNLTVEANQQATPTAGNFYGVYITGTGSLLQSTGSGLVTIKGKGGDDAGGVQFGIWVESGGKISGGTGSLNVTGNGGASSDNGNVGVYVFSINSLITSLGGNVTVTGTGGGSGTSRDNYGVYVSAAGQITAGGMGSVTVTGNGGTIPTGTQNFGVSVHGPNARITSSGGNVSVNGTGGGSGAIVQNYGIDISSFGQITAGGMGTITVTGQGGTTTTGGINRGINIIGASITSSGGNIIVTGTGGGAGITSNNNGINMSGAQITAGGSGTVTLTGTGGATSGSANLGLNILSGSMVTSGGGAISITGKEGSGTAGVGIVTDLSTITTATNGGNLTLIANSMDIRTGTSVSTNAAGTLTLRPFTTNTAINLGAATNPIGGPLSLSDAELDLVSAGTLIIGDATGGAITLSADITRPTATNVQLLSAGDVNLSGGGFNTNGGTLFLDPGNTPAAVKPTFNDTDVTASTLSFGSDLAIAINGTTPGTQYDQLKVVGSINLTGVSLVLSGAPALVGGETFTIVDNDGNDAITGTFTGLAQSAVISNFLGSGLNASISYTGGTGNDVVITTGCPSFASPTASVTVQPTCTTPTGTIVVTAPTGENIQYSVGSAYQASATFSGLTPNIYNLTAKNTTTGCISTALSLTVNAIPDAPATPTASVTIQPTCTTPTGTIVVTAPTGANIQYSVGGAYQTSATFSGLTPNTYNVTAKNTATGCISTALSLTVNAIPDAPATPTASVTVQPTCSTPTGTIVITAPTGANIQYSVGGTYQTSATFSGLAPATYNLTAKNTTTDCISTALGLTVNAIPDAPATPTASVTVQPTCTTPTGTIVVTAPTGGNIQYSVGGAYQTSATFSGLTPNTYNVTAKNTATGCVSTVLNLTVNAIPDTPATPTASVTAQPTCTTPTGTIVITAPAGANIQYSVGGAYQTSATFSGLTPNTYNVTAKNTATGCVSTVLNLTVNAIPDTPATPTASVTAQPTCTTPTGTIVITAPAGANIQYSVGSAYQASATFSGLTPNTYNVTAKNTATGCISTALSLTVNAIPDTPATPTASVTAQPTCTTPTGTIIITAPTGANIQYSVGSAYQASATFSGLTPSTYNVTAKNTATGCISTPLSLTVNAVITPSATINYAGSPYVNVGTASVTLTGTTGGTFSSTAGLSINAATGGINLASSTPGAYTVTYTIAANGSCGQFQTTAQVQITSSVHIIYVNVANATSGQDGTSWAKAFSNLQAGLSAAASKVGQTQVWVAQGTYVPGTLRKDVFEIPSGVEVYGGFVGNETLLGERNWKTHKTTLSGEIGTNSLNDNINHIVLLNATNADTRLDGFTVEKGFADFVSSNQNTNLSEPALLSSGGGILVLNKSRGIITNCIITNNRAIAGGGILLQDSSKVSITQTILWGNEATFGGGLYVLGGSRPELINLLIVNNKGIGGGLYVNRSEPKLMNCTISSNRGNDGTAGGIFNTNAVTTVKNSIIWGNSSPQSTPGSVISYSIVEGGYGGTGNLNQNPLFVNATPSGLAPMGSLGDYHLQNCSPAINAGDNMDAPTIDLEGNNRPFATGVTIADMGAYESQSTGGGGPANLNVTDNIASGTVLKSGGKITATNQISGGTVEYRGSESVTLLPGFSASTAVFQAVIGGCQTSAPTNVESNTQK